MNSDKFEKLFLRLVSAYVKTYDEHSFEICLDGKECLKIGDSTNIVNVRITDSGKVLERIFVEGSLGLGESYCEGLIDVDDKLYKYFLFIFVRAAYDKRLLFSLPVGDILVILKAKFNRAFFEKSSKAENINTHYSLSEWFDDEKDANDFYLYWLNSEYIQYTCAKWDEGVETLEEAQTNKLKFYAQRLGIGILEHISHYDDLYAKTSKALKPGGKALFHAIFHTEPFYKVDPFLSKYIFPGGSTPEIKRNLKIFRKYFTEVDRNDLPDYSYPKTLDCWFDDFCKNEEGIRKLLAEKGKVSHVDFSIRVFKHYLMLSYCGLSQKSSLVANVLVRK